MLSVACSIALCCVLYCSLLRALCFFLDRLYCFPTGAVLTTLLHTILYYILLYCILLFYVTFLLRSLFLFPAFLFRARYSLFLSLFTGSLRLIRI